MNEETKRKECLDQRNSYIKDLSTGSFGLYFIFVDKIVQDTIQRPGILVYSWVMFACSVICCLLSFICSKAGFKKAIELDEKIYKKIKEYKEREDAVIFTFDTHSENYLNTVEGKHLPVSHCLKGTKGHSLYGKVASLFDKEKDIYFEKETFPSLDLANYLRGQEFDSVELCGLVSNICVLSNAVIVKASLPNVEIYVNRNLTASFDEKINEECMDILKGLHVNVID